MMNKILLFLLQHLIVLLVRYEKTWKPTWRRIKDLFAKNPKMAYVVKCKNCEHQFWGKTKFRYPKNMCPNCEAKFLIVNPSDISIKERERMWRFLDDHDKETNAELDHDELVEDSLCELDMEYEGHWGDTPHAYAHEMAEKVREDLR